MEGCLFATVTFQNWAGVGTATLQLQSKEGTGAEFIAKLDEWVRTGAIHPQFPNFRAVSYALRYEGDADEPHFVGG